MPESRLQRTHRAAAAGFFVFLRPIQKGFRMVFDDRAAPGRFRRMPAGHSSMASTSISRALP